MTATLPSVLTYGQVKWQVLTTTADTLDPDALPDAVAIAGTVTFTPSAQVLLVGGDAPATMIGAPQTYNLDANGVLRDRDGRAAVTLLATDNPLVSPLRWTWTASYQLTGYQRATFSFQLAAGTTVDLTTVAPVTASSGVAITRGEKGDKGDPGAGLTPAEIAALPELRSAFVAHLGAATADDTARINALLEQARLAGGGTLIGAPGVEYKISAPLVVGSHTTLDLSWSDLRLLPGANSHMVTNYAAYHPVATATDAAVTSGSAVVTTSLAQQAVVGQTLTVYGAGSNGFGYLIGNVAAVDRTAGTITLTKLHGPPAAATATVTAAKVVLSPRDRHVHVKVRKANRGANGPNGSTGVPESAVAGHSIYLKHVDHFTADVGEGITTGGVSFIWPTDASFGRVAFRGGSVVRTAVQAVGPIYQLHVETVRGYSNDDLINLCGNVYPDQTDTSGDVIGVTVGDVIAYGDTHASAFKLNAGQGNLIDRIKVTGRISGTSTQSTAYLVWIGRDVTYGQTDGGKYGTIDLGLVDTVGTASALDLRTPDLEHLTVRTKFAQFNPVFIRGDVACKIGVLDITLDAANHSVTNGVLSQGTLAEIDTLVLRTGAFNGQSVALAMLKIEGNTFHHILADGLSLNPPSALWRLLLATGGTVDRLTVRDVYARYATANSGTNLVQNDGGTIGTVVVSGRVVNGDTIVRHNSGTLAEVHFTDLTTEGGSRLLNVQTGSVDAYLTNVVRTASGSPAVNVAAGATVNFRAGSFRATGGTSSALVTKAGTANAFSLGLRADVGSELTKVANGQAFNTNAALSCGVGPVVCDGTSWKHLFTGATY